MIKLINDGANYQAQAVLAMLGNFKIEESWNDTTKDYDANFRLGRWENCREQGYILSLRSSDYKRQLNIAWFEHRNSDSICAIKWEQLSTNSLNIDTANFNGQCYSDKWDVSKSVGYGQILEMKIWIEEQFTKFWVDTKNDKMKAEN